MAGVIAAIQNGVGIIGGAAKVAKLISTRALYDDKMGSFGTMMAAIDGCVENGAKSKFLSRFFLCAVVALTFECHYLIKLVIFLLVPHLCSHCFIPWVPKLR